jgi:hypothetical protein
MARFGLDLGAPRVDWRGAHPASEESGFPLYEALCSIAWRGPIRLGELHYAWARGISCFGWLLGLMALMLWVRRRLPGPSLAYVVLYLFSPLMFAFSRNIQPDVLALGIVLIGLERIDRSRDRGGASELWLVLGALGVGAGASMDGSLLPLVVLAAVVGEAQSRPGRSALRVLLAFLLASLPPLVWFLHAQHLGDGSFLAAIFGGGQSPWGGPALWFSSASVSALGGTLLVTVLTPLGLLLLALTGKAVWQDLALRNFSVGALLVLVSAGVFTAAFSLRSFEWLPLVPFASVLMGPGLLAALSPTGLGPRWVVRGLALSLLIVSIGLGGSYVDRALARDQRVEFLAHIVSAAVLAQTPIVVSDRHPQSLLFAMDRRGWHRGDLSLAEIQRLEQAGARFLLITSTSPAWTNRPFRFQVEETRPVVARGADFVLTGLRGQGSTRGVSGVPGVGQ